MPTRDRTIPAKQGLCKRSGCGNFTPSTIFRFCGPYCADIYKAQKAAWGRKGGLKAGLTRRARMEARVGNLTPQEAYRLGYKRGLQSKHYDMQRRRRA